MATKKKAPKAQKVVLARILMDGEPKSAVPPWDPRIDSCWVDWNVSRGIYRLELFSHGFPAPIGFLYGIAGGRADNCEPRFDVLHCYTMEMARRQGVQRRILRAIFDEMWVGEFAVKRITSPNATKFTGGLELARSIGFVKSEAADLWVLTVEDFHSKNRNKPGGLGWTR
jgi:hypothetical protein